MQIRILLEFEPRVIDIETNCKTEGTEHLAPLIFVPSYFVVTFDYRKIEMGTANRSNSRARNER